VNRVGILIITKVIKGERITQKQKKEPETASYKTPLTPATGVSLSEKYDYFHDIYRNAGFAATSTVCLNFPFLLR
jgi:hypothetical protein